MSVLFEPRPLGPLLLKNRMVMAPMTRARTSQPGNIPNALMAEYYAQRASAGLIISEATQISPQGQGYSFTPGIHSAAQIDGWRNVTAAVHDAGGHILLQLWHVGRMSHTRFHQGARPVAPSAIAPQASIWLANPETGVGEMVPCPVPRAMSGDDIAATVEDYRQAAANAMAAGFDGVELHAGNGYLIDSFLRSSSNQRTDAYGGCVENRMRFALDVVDAVVGEVGAERTGIRLSPFITQRGMDDPETPATVLALATELQRRALAYIHLAEADWDDAPPTPLRFRHALRQRFQGTIIVAGGYDQPAAEAMLASKLVDLVAFGRPFIANPDLPDRFAQQYPLAPFDSDTLFGGGASGYTRYPAWSATAD